MDAPNWNGGPDDEPVSGAERERASKRSEGGHGYRCVDCSWTGRGPSAAVHHYQTKHRIELKSLGLLAVFSDTRGGDS